MEIFKSERWSWVMEPYHFSYLHYEYGWYQCLASLRLIRSFFAAEKLSGIVGFLTRQLVRTKTFLILTCMKMFDSWSWTKRIYCGLMFHWAWEKPQTLSPLWIPPLGCCVSLEIRCVWGFQMCYFKALYICMLQFYNIFFSFFIICIWQSRDIL